MARTERDRPQLSAAPALGDPENDWSSDRLQMTAANTAQSPQVLPLNNRYSPQGLPRFRGAATGGGYLPLTGARTTRGPGNPSAGRPVMRRFVLAAAMAAIGLSNPG